MAVIKIKKVKTKKELIKEAKENTSTQLKDGREIVDKKDGLPLTHTTKKNPQDLDKDKIGLSKGVTVNMGDFQSMRVDCWLTTSLEEGETQQQALTRIGKIIDERVNLEIEKVQDNM